MGSNGFGIDCQDIDGDGQMDIWLATISHPVDSDESRKWSDPSMLLLNKGAAGGFSFANATLDRGLPFNEGDIDAAAVDFDNDGRIDLSVTRDKKYEPNYSTPDQLSWFGLMHQNEDGTFKSMGMTSGINDRDRHDRSREGRTEPGLGRHRRRRRSRSPRRRPRQRRRGPRELPVREHDRPEKWLDRRSPARRRHDREPRRHRRARHGDRRRAAATQKKYIREVKSSRGTYSSADSRSLLFGLGGAPQSCEDGLAQVAIEVRWPNGETKRYDAGSFALNQYVSIDYAGALVPAPAR